MQHGVAAIRAARPEPASCSLRHTAASASWACIASFRTPPHRRPRRRSPRPASSPSTPSVTPRVAWSRRPRHRQPRVPTLAAPSVRDPRMRWYTLADTGRADRGRRLVARGAAEEQRAVADCRTRTCHLGRRHRHPRGESGPSCPRHAAARRDGVTWSLPKGTPDADETIEQTALARGRRRRPASRSASSRRSAPSTTSSSRTARASTRPSTTS